MKVAVNTPTGNIGRVLSEHLINAGADVVLLARNPEKVEKLTDRGAVVHRGDLQDADFVVGATKGVDVLFWVTPPNYGADNYRDFQRKLGKIAARAVKENSIPRVVVLSSIGAHLGSGTGPIAGLGDVEKTLEETGADITHLRAGFFMENYFMSAKTIAGQNVIFLPVDGGAKMPMVATADIAKAAAKRILDKTWAGRSVLELIGPSEVTFDDAAEMIGSALGRDVKHVKTTLDQTRKALTEMGVRPDTADSFVEMYDAFGKARIVPESPNSVKVATTTFRSFAETTFAPALQAMGAHRS